MAHLSGDVCAFCGRTAWTFGDFGSCEAVYSCGGCGYKWSDDGRKWLRVEDESDLDFTDGRWAEVPEGSLLAYGEEPL